jgi:hypothetical protein
MRLQVADFRDSYAQWGHQLDKVRVGLPAPHDPRDGGPICWRWCNISLARRSWASAAATLDAHAANWQQHGQEFAAAAASKVAAASKAADASKPSPHKTRPHSLPQLSACELQPAQQAAGVSGPRSPGASGCGAAAGAPGRLSSPLRGSRELLKVVVPQSPRPPGEAAGSRPGSCSPASIAAARLSGAAPASSLRPGSAAAAGQLVASPVPLGRASRVGAAGSPISSLTAAALRDYDTDSAESADDEDSDSEKNSVAELVSRLRCSSPMRQR